MSEEIRSELFLVVDGRLRMQVRDRNREVGPGEFIIVPKGVEHCPLALTDEVHVVLLEPKTTVNTGTWRTSGRWRRNSASDFSPRMVEVT